MKTLYIKDLEKNLIIAGETFVVNSIDFAEDKNGKSYANLILGDKTGKVNSKIWSDKLAIIDKKILKPGNILSISGKVDEFKGDVQINVYDATQVDETKLDEYLESSIFDSEDMYSELITTAETIQRKDLKKVILTILKDKEIERRLKYWPAAEVVHHSFRSGLLQHILEMLTIMNGLERFYPEVDYDILKSGIILHDIGKIDEFEFSGVNTEYSKLGSLIGHIVRGSQIFAKFAEGKLNEDIYLHIMHLILSHHGVLEYGSPVVPATVEAIMLANIDNLSAKSRTADAARVTLKDGQDFTNRIHWLEGAKIWKGTKAQEDEAEGLTSVNNSSKDEPSLF